jgi:hypothetical protein
VVDCSYRAGGRACALAPSPSPRPPSAPTLRERKGEGGPHLPPDPLPLPRRGRGRGRAALTFPPTPFRSHAVGEEGGGCPSLSPQPLPLPDEERKGGDEPSSGASASFNDAAFTTQLTPLPQRGRGAGGEGSAGEGPGVRAARDRDLPLLDNSPTLWYCSTTLHLREGDISRTIELRDRQSCPAMHSGTDRRLINRLFGIPTVQSNAPAVGT